VPRVYWPLIPSLLVQHSTHSIERTRPCGVPGQFASVLRLDIPLQPDSPKPAFKQRGVPPAAAEQRLPPGGVASAT